MELFKEAVDYLETQHIPVEAVDGTGPDPLEDDVFPEEDVFSPLQTDSMDLPDTPVLRTLEEMLVRRLMVLRKVLDSEKIYLNELETLLMPMKALKATAGTSQPVLSSQQVRTVFYQVPELRDLHRDFYTCLRDRLGPLGPQIHPETDPGQGPGKEQGQMNFHLTVGDLFLKISMMFYNGSDKSKTEYTFEALLYKPLDRVTKTTLVLHDLLKHTPQTHGDHPVLLEALRLSQSFLSGVNEGSQCKQEVTLSRGMRRQLMRDGFVVDVCEGGRNLCHLFLYTDLLLCTKLKGGAQGKQAQYRFCWYLPLAGLKLRWGPEMERTTDTHQRIHTMRAKMYVLRHELRQIMKPVPLKSLAARTSERGRKKMEHLELMFLTQSPFLPWNYTAPAARATLW
ncbi:active breakpoint cluster region-related protein isoform X3 [Oncorhynchus tshawytscha]|uniref:active breakpoint cluster region-related protein isoform X3 n=1 Tax=Oncorhynchus tshawytscha TaxID=74940 RepID=UPI001C3D67D1|nr:active breakpoint cluster region-related protein isoform X3 [Oncorhynchus tshawytscha]